MVRKKCVNCLGNIDISKEKYVLLGTYNGTGKAKHDEQFFHFDCWREYFQGCVRNKVGNTMTKATGMLQNALKQLGGNEGDRNTLKTFNIQNEIPNIDIQVEGVENLWETKKKKKKKKVKN